MDEPRTSTDRYLEQNRVQLDVAFDTDLGELVRGHHVIARGISFGRPTDLHRWQADMDSSRLRPPLPGPSERDCTVVRTRPSEAELFYEFVPGLNSWEEDIEPGYWYWTLHTSDDLGTDYCDANNGTRESPNGGAVTHASRDLGGHVPEAASRLFIYIEPPPRWQPPEPWRRQLVIDLQHGRVIESL